jgi:hypothetical protein
LDTATQAMGRTHQRKDFMLEAETGEIFDVRFSHRAAGRLGFT